MQDAEKKRSNLRPMMMFIILAVAYFFVYFHRTTGGAVSDTIQDFYDVGTASVALLASAYLYAYTLMMIPSGILTDRLGPRKAATMFILLIAAGSVFSSFSATSNNFNLMIAGKFLIGIGAAVVYIPALKILAVWFAKDRFASMNGALLLIGNVGSIAAATPMVIMMDSWGIANTYLVLSAVTVFIAVLCWLIVRDRPESDTVVEERRPEIGIKESLKKVFSSGRRFWPLAIWLFIMYGTLMLWQASQAGSFYRSVYGFSTASAGMMVTMVGVGMAAACPLAGIISDRILKSRRKVLIIGSFLYTIAWGIIALLTNLQAGNDVILQGAVNVFLGFSAGFSVVAFAQIKELFPVEMAGTSVAALNLFPFAGGAILVTISGFLVSSKSLEEYSVLWTVVFVLMVLVTVLSFFTEDRNTIAEKE